MRYALLMILMLLAGCDNGSSATSEPQRFKVTHSAPIQHVTQWGYNWNVAFTVTRGEGFDGFVIETTINHADNSVTTLVEFAEWRGFAWRTDTQGGASGETRTVVYYAANADGYVANAEGMAYLPANMDGTHTTSPDLSPIAVQGTITKADKSRAITFVIDTSGAVVDVR